MLTLARLHYVVSVAEHGSFGRAAATLGISQPALTKSVQSLESALGVRLFDRHSRGVVLTEFGRLVVSHTHDLLAREGELIRNVRLLANLEVGQLDVTLGPYPSVISGYAAAGALMARHPGLRVALRVAGWREVTQAVVQRKTELGIAELSDAVLNDQLETELVGRHRARAFCRPGHPLLQRERVTLGALMEFPWVFTRLPPRVSAVLPRHPGRAGRIDELNGEFVPAVEVDVPMQLGTLVAGNDMVAFGAFAMVERDLDERRIVYLPTPDVEMPGSYGFMYLKRRSLSRAARAYMDAVREHERLFVERDAMLERQFGQRPPWPSDSVTAGLESDP